MQLKNYERWDQVNLVEISTLLLNSEGTCTSLRLSEFIAFWGKVSSSHKRIKGREENEVTHLSGHIFHQKETWHKVLDRVSRREQGAPALWESMSPPLEESK